MLTQYILTAVIVAVAVAYAVWRVYERFQQAGPCQGCALAGHCRKRGMRHRAQKACNHTKQSPMTPDKSQS